MTAIPTFIAEHGGNFRMVFIGCDFACLGCFIQSTRDDLISVPTLTRLMTNCLLAMLQRSYNKKKCVDNNEIVTEGPS